jgi:hypothetical protein
MASPTLLGFMRPEIHLEGGSISHTVGGLESIMIVPESLVLIMTLSAPFAGRG